jgi:hypothetical protein
MVNDAPAGYQDQVRSTLRELLPVPETVPILFVPRYTQAQLSDPIIREEIRRMVLQALTLCAGSPMKQEAPFELQFEQINKLVKSIKDLQDDHQAKEQERQRERADDAAKYAALQEQLERQRKAHLEEQKAAYERFQAHLSEMLKHQLPPSGGHASSPAPQRPAPPSPPDCVTLIKLKRMNVKHDKNNLPRIHHHPPESHFLPDGRYVHTWLFVNPKQGLKYIHVWYTFFPNRGWVETSSNRGVRNRAK